MSTIQAIKINDHSSLKLISKVTCKGITLITCKLLNEFINTINTMLVLRRWIDIDMFLHIGMWCISIVWRHRYFH